MTEETPFADLPIPPLQRRQAAAQGTLDQWRGKVWDLGQRDCGKLTASHLRRLGIRVKLARVGSYRTPVAARLALKRLGFDSLGAAMDAHFPRIPPAAALVADILELPSSDPHGIGALVIAMGNGRVLGWHESQEGAVVMQPSEYVAAWRVIP